MVSAVNGGAQNLRKNGTAMAEHRTYGKDGTAMVSASATTEVTTAAARVTAAEVAATTAGTAAA